LKGGEIQPTGTKEHTLSKWLDEWLETHKKTKVQSTTYDNYMNLAAHVKKHRIGGLKLSQVKPIHITEFFASISEYSHSFRKQMQFLINGCLECGIDNDFCTKNPVRRATIKKKLQGWREAFTEDEVRTITNFAKSDKLFGVPILIMLNTGIRSGEMRALTYNKIDFVNNVITIDESIKQTGEIGLPKNNKPRHVPIKREFAKLLKAKIDENTK